MIQVGGWCAPAITRLGNKLYAVPSYTELPEGTTLNMLEWVRPTTPKASFKTKHVGKYIITIYDSGRVTCDCPGFTFRKKCKHSAEFMT